jgi:hypothetical protein
MAKSWWPVLVVVLLLGSCDALYLGASDLGWNLASVPGIAIVLGVSSAVAMGIFLGPLQDEDLPVLPMLVITLILVASIAAIWLSVVVWAIFYSPAPVLGYVELGLVAAGLALAAIGKLSDSEVLGLFALIFLLIPALLLTIFLILAAGGGPDGHGPYHGLPRRR